MLSKAIRLTILSYISQVVTMLMAFVEAKVLTSTLSISNFGAFNQIITTTGLISIVLCLNLGHAFIRFASSYDSVKKEQTFHTVLITQTLLYTFFAILILPFGCQISSFLTDINAIYPCIFLGAFAITAGAISNIQNYLLVSGKEIVMITQNIYKMIINVLFVVAGVLLSPTLIGAMFGYLCGDIACILFFSVKNKINYRGLKINKGILVELLRFGLPLLVANVTYWTVNTSNRYFLNYFCGLESVGQFAIATKLPMMIVTIFTLLSTVFLSNTSRLFDDGNIDRVSYWFTKMVKVFVSLGTSGAVFLIMAHRSVTLIVAQPEYLFPHIDEFYFWTCAGSLSFGVFQIVSKVFDLEKKVKQISTIWTSILIVNVVLNFILIPTYGILGAGWAMTATFVLGLLFALIFRPRNIKFEVSWIKMFVYLSLSIIVSLIAVNLFSVSNVSVWIELMVALLFMFMVFAVGLLIKVLTYSELKELIYSK